MAGLGPNLGRLRASHIVRIADVRSTPVSGLRHLPISVAPSRCADRYHSGWIVRCVAGNRTGDLRVFNMNGEDAERFAHQASLIIAGGWNQAVRDEGAS